MIRRAPSKALGLAGAMVGPFLYVSSAQGADAVVRVTLRYEAVAGCPDEVAFRSQVRSRTERLTWVSSEADRRFAASVTIRGGELVGQLDVDATDGSRASRQVPGKTCDEVVAALALIAALAVDPNASAAEPREPAGATAREGSSPPPLPASRPAAESSPVSPELGLAAPRANRIPVSASADEGSSWRTGLAAGAGVATGVFPSAAWLASVFVDASRNRTRGWSPSVRLTFSGTARQSYAADHGQAQYQWLFGTLDACPARIALGTAASVRACGFVEGGVLLAGATGFDHAQPQSHGWEALGLLARLQWAAGPWWFEGAMGPRLALSHPTYWVEVPESNRIHEVAVVGLAATTAIGFRLP